MTPTDNNREAVRRYRAKMRAAGWVQKTVWTHAEDWPTVKALIDRLNKERERE